MTELDERTVSKWRNQAYLEAADPIVIHDMQGRIMDVNDEAVRTFGWTREELVGKFARMLIPPERRAQHRYLLRRCRAGKTVRNVESARWTKSGNVLPMLVSLAPLTDSHDQPMAVTTLSKDLTDVKQTTDDLKRSKLELKTLQSELMLAAHVQRQLYPSRGPSLPGWDFGGSAISAGHGCGDYFDFIPASDGRWWIAVGDVSGHGFPQALMMVEVRAALRILALRESDPVVIVKQVNELLLDRVHFITLFLALHDPTEGTITYMSGGQPGYVLEASGQVRVLESTSMPLGMDGIEAFAANCDAASSLCLAVGDILVVPTDGILESRSTDPGQFGQDRMVKVLRASSDATADEMVQNLLQAAKEFAGDSLLTDDMTVVVIKRL